MAGFAISGPSPAEEAIEKETLAVPETAWVRDGMGFTLPGRNWRSHNGRSLVRMRPQLRNAQNLLRRDHQFAGQVRGGRRTEMSVKGSGFVRDCVRRQR